MKMPRIKRKKKLTVPRRNPSTPRQRRLLKAMREWLKTLDQQVGTTEMNRAIELMKQRNIRARTNI